MKNTVKRFMSISIDHYRDIEYQLEKLASKGLFLVKIGSFFWEFRKGEPKSIKYTVTYFSEGSIFNPSMTDNQCEFIDYAEQSDWHFVTEFNQLQIFCSDSEHPTPFETDEHEKFANIKKCMKKSFLPSFIMLLAIFSFNMVMQFNSIMNNPVYNFLNPESILPFISIVLVNIYYAYMIISYLLWCYRTKKSLASGGTCVERNGKLNRYLNISLFSLVSTLFALFFLLSIQDSNIFIIVLSALQVPLLLVVYHKSISAFKKAKMTATSNKVISFIILLVVSFSYIGFIMFVVVSIMPTEDTKDAYRTIVWVNDHGDEREYPIYNDEIPLTVQDLYGEIDYDDYSYSAEYEDSFLLSRHIFEQSPPPFIYDTDIPDIYYRVFVPQYDFVYDILAEHMLSNLYSTTAHSIDPLPFGANTVYELRHISSELPTGAYLLYYDDKIISIGLYEDITDEHMAVIKEKLADY